MLFNSHADLRANHPHFAHQIANSAMIQPLCAKIATSFQANSGVVMNLSVTTQTITLALLLAAFALARPASAHDRYRHDSAYSYGYGHDNGAYRHGGRGHHRQHRHRYSRAYADNGYGYAGGYNSQRRACGPVSKMSYDDYGNRVRIGGTQCYDNYGKPYIVRGSRYIIDRY